MEIMCVRLSDVHHRMCNSVEEETTRDEIKVLSEVAAFRWLAGCRRHRLGLLPVTRTGVWSSSGAAAATPAGVAATSHEGRFFVE